MRNRIPVAAALLAALASILLLLSCSARKPAEAASAAEPAQGGKQLIAEVNGVPIYASDLNLSITRFEHKLTLGGAQDEPGSEEALGQAALQTLIENELLFQEARRRGFTAAAQEVDEELATIAAQFPGEAAFEKSLAQMEITKEDLRRDLERGQAVQKMIAAEIEPGITVNPEQVRAYYDANPQQFTDPERVHARHIFLKVVPGTTEEQKIEMRRTLEQLRKRVLQGESFEALADQYSQDPNSGEGGDLGYLVRRKQTNNEFEKALFSLQAGQMSGVVRSVYGYHLIQAVDYQPPRLLSFERVKGSLAGFLHGQKVDQAVTALAEELRDKAKITIPGAR
jgi:parvulin-like peptidyl-prolyl isomerase